MRHRATLTSLAVVLVTFSFSVEGCSGAVGTIDDPVGDPGSDNPGEPLDSGAPGDPHADTGSPGTDTGTPGTDTGTPGTDSGGPATDSGTGTDSGTATDSGTPTDTGSDTGTPTDGDPTGGMDYASGLTITEIALFQGTKVDLMSGGSKSSHLAPVIVGRPGLLRVYTSGSSSAAVTGVLTLSTGATISSTPKPISGTGSDGSLDSTINFDLDASAIQSGTSYSVALKVASGSGSSSPGGALYPASGQDAFGAVNTGSTLKVTLVPVQYDADGSGRLPDTSATQVANFKSWMYKIYPAQNIDVTVRSPYPYSSAIDASGSGWSEILNAIVSLRASDGAPDDVYYFGAFAPSSSFDTYCGGGCVTGLSGLITSASDPSGRASVGIGFSGDVSGETMAHEIGHAHGRAHAPCGGAAGPDPAYPYSGASIGVWGYDISAKTLFDPSKYTDLMGYCDPVWISDYGFNQLATRMEYVAAHPSMHFPPGALAKSYRWVTIAPDGTLKWGSEVPLKTPPEGEPHTVYLRDATGAIVDTVVGSYYPYNELGGGYMLVPVNTDFDSIRLDGFPPEVQAELTKSF